ncbi:MAG TPA: flippase [Sphingomicrobium sp.]|nr:flippase [Sphingomicrobium sp.]
MSVRRNTIYNLLGAALPVGVSLLTVPLYLARIGEARFGILSIVWLLLGYFGLFDLGLGMATAQQTAAREKDGRATQARIFWTALLTNLALGIIGGVIAWPVAQYYFAHVMKVDEALRSEIIAALPWLILAVPLATVTGVATGALQGLHRFATLNIISVAGTMLFQLLPLAAAYFFSVRLTVVLPMAILARVLTLLVLWLDCHVNLLRSHPVAYDRSMVRVLLSFGFWVTISAFFAPFMTLIDRFVIGGFISAAAVTAYAVPFNLGDRLCIFGNSAGSALFPRFSSLSKDEARQVAYNSERVLLATMVPISLAAIFLIGPFISIWVSPEFSLKSAPAGEILMAGIWLDAVSRIPLYALRGQFRPQVVAKIDLIVLLPYWLCLYWLISKFGIEGAAAAYVFRVGLNYLLLSGAAGTLTRIWWMLLGCGLLILLALAAARELEPLSAGWSLAFTSCVLLGAVLALNVFPASERQLISAKLRRLGPRQGLSR